MWIRSQNKEILINSNGVRMIFPYQIYDINTNICLGIYCSKQKAIEVLDEIQHKLCDEASRVTKYGDMEWKSYCVFEMPQE
jgi:hypothetical protein